ncbi:MAG: kinase/pyrophosphorylase [Zoogloeaceae bacterium]|jgi:regulator of PEP synthase PpsR (kinase-PPPase family)|nr:kinase/pyrophosphorylase [Zoogloeaceae bacterium]
MKRAVFFVSDSTGITVEALGHSLLSQFEGVEYDVVRRPFISDEAEAREVVAQIAQHGKTTGVRPLAFTTLINPALAEIVHLADAFCISYFEAFLAPLEEELGVKSSHTVGRTHGSTNSLGYKRRIDAINYTLAHDDGVTDRDLNEADVVLVGVSRCGKTPTSLYLAMQFGLKAANFPLIPEDFERGTLPECLRVNRSKLFGLTIDPERLAQIRAERRPDSTYASLANCRQEVANAERMMRREGIRWLDSSRKSIEEIAATVLQELQLQR